MSAKTKKIIPWGLIIFTFIVFFPIGMYLIVKRVKEDKTGLVKNRKVLTIIGCFSIFMGILGVIQIVISNSGEPVQDVVICFILIGLYGIYCMVKSLKMKQIIQKIERYKRIIGINYRMPITRLMSDSHKHCEDTIKELEWLINKQYIDDISIDYGKQEVIIPSHYEANRNAQTFHSIPQGSNTRIREKAVSCKHCGASNRIIVGEQKECEFCGILIDNIF